MVAPPKMSNSKKSAAAGKANAKAFQDKERPSHIRASNISAGKGKLIATRFLNIQLYLPIFIGIISHSCLSAVAEAIRTSLGPKGMDKMVRNCC
jgi:hypothetical protein